MKLKNSTYLQTHPLRSFLLRAFRESGVIHRGLTVEIGWSTKRGRNRGCTHGRASYGYRTPWQQGRYIQMCITRNSAEFSVDSFARVLEHEIAHTLGRRHEEMSNELRYCCQSTPAWAVGVTLPFKIEKPKTPKPTGTDLAEIKREHALEMQAKWERKAKMATKKAKSWRNKAKYHERRAAAFDGKS